MKSPYRLVKTLAPHTVVQIACGANHCLALLNNGVLYSWGDNENGQLGIGTVGEVQFTPQEITNLMGEFRTEQMSSIRRSSSSSFAYTHIGQVTYPTVDRLARCRSYSMDVFGNTLEPRSGARELEALFHRTKNHSDAS